MLTLLIGAAAKGAIVVASAMFVIWAFRIRAAATRHAIWTAAVLAHLLLPPLALLLPTWNQPVSGAPAWLALDDAPVAPTTTAAPQQPAAPTPSATDASTDASRSVPNTATEPTGGTVGGEFFLSGFSATQILFALWAAGALVILLRFVIGTVRVAQLARTCERVEDGSWLSLVQRLAKRLHINRPLILLRGDRLGIPVTWGVVYPVVLLPDESKTWPEERRQFVLLHEMAHVLRFDALTQLMSQLALAVFWFSPFVWIAAHRMRLERERACDDVVLREGTAPSMYANELLEMVQTLGTPGHEAAGPAFAALAMARKSEFEGRMLAILNPRLDRRTQGRGETLMTALFLMLLVAPLAALRPFAPSPPIAAGSTVSATPTPGATPTASPSPSAGAVAPYSCSTASLSRSGHSNHINISDGDEELTYYSSTRGRCVEGRIRGEVKISLDGTAIERMTPSSLIEVRERTTSSDRTARFTPAREGVIREYRVNGTARQVDASAQAWMSAMLAELVRESGMFATERVRAIRAVHGADGVLTEIGRIRSTGAKRHYYEALLVERGLTDREVARTVRLAGSDFGGSSGDLSAVLRRVPPRRSSATVEALSQTLRQIDSDGDARSVLSTLAQPETDPATLLMLMNSAAEIDGDGDKSGFLVQVASKYLTPDNASLRTAFFDTYRTLSSDGDKARVLSIAIPYGHSRRAVTLAVIDAARTIDSDGDKARVLVQLAHQRLLTTAEIRSAFGDVARTISSDGDYRRVIDSATMP